MQTAASASSRLSFRYCPSRQVRLGTALLLPSLADLAGALAALPAALERAGLAEGTAAGTLHVALTASGARGLRLSSAATSAAAARTASGEGP